MKMLGLIGGMSWESSAHYYRLINEGVRAARGPTASAKCLLWSFDFSEIEILQRTGDWDRQEVLLIDAARRLAGAGVEALLICTNTMHLMAEAVEAAAGVPLLHIADPTGAAVKAAGIKRVALLGTAFTMEQDFYRRRLSEKHGLDVLVPEAEDRALVHRVIYDELVAGVVRDESRAAYRAVISRLVERGAEGVILGCTEIMLLVDQSDSSVPLFDTTELHANAAVTLILSQ
jgi:aspartate racemase